MSSDDWVFTILRATALTLCFLLASQSLASESVLKPYGSASKKSTEAHHTATAATTTAPESKSSSSLFRWFTFPPKTIMGWGVLLGGAFALLALIAGISGGPTPQNPEIQPRSTSSRRSLSPSSCAIALAPDNKEAFTTFATNPERVYRVAISGTSTVTSRTRAYDGTTTEATTVVDPLYRVDWFGNFAEPHHTANRSRQEGLFIDGKPLNDVPHEVARVDRDAHEYEFLFDGTGQKLALSFRINGVHHDHLFSATVTECDETILTREARAAAEVKRQQEEQLEHEVALRVVLSEMQRNWADPEFLKAAASADPHKFLSQHAAIREHHRKLHFENPALLAKLEQDHPEVVKRLNGMLEAFVIAERVSIARPQPRPRLTYQDIRARLVRRAIIAAGDKTAIIRVASEAWEEQAAELRAAGCDQDEIEQTLGTKSQAIEEALAALEEQKEARNGAKTSSLA